MIIMCHRKRRGFVLQGRRKYSSGSHSRYGRLMKTSTELLQGSGSKSIKQSRYMLFILQQLHLSNWSLAWFDFSSLYWTECTHDKAIYSRYNFVHGTSTVSMSNCGCLCNTSLSITLISPVPGIHPSICSLSGFGHISTRGLLTFCLWATGERPIASSRAPALHILYYDFLFLLTYSFTSNFEQSKTLSLKHWSPWTYLTSDGRLPEICQGAGSLNGRRTSVCNVAESSGTTL